uniref:Ubiquitin carboxyl-terminal hydrolase MINDY n=1 Tax=Xenopsylla cheopis TaxID=163159 RepID=A0A6M2DD93_XENCH
MSLVTAMELKNDVGESSRVQEIQEVSAVLHLLWGSEIKQEVFQRWSQGFAFSPDEPSALVQNEGGPCAVIAPVQAFLLKILLSESPGPNFQDLTEDKCNKLLIRALCNILLKCVSKKYKILDLSKTSHSKTKIVNSDGNKSELSESPEHDTESAKVVLSANAFHERICTYTFDTIQDVELFYDNNVKVLFAPHGVLLFLYSVLLTKGVDQVKNELNDTSEPLIHDTYGYGSQGLINLMLTGKAVAHVWDHVQDIGGLKLRGIDQQADIGFITLMEQMRYCTVGSFFKNPKNPVWVMGSETHLTVLFSFEKLLVSPETASESARRVFKQFDPEGNNFISSILLQDVLCALNLVSDPEYVDIMRKKLDAENLGIILLNSFMDEFFAGEKRSTPDCFTLYHYNGLPRSNANNKVTYQRGTAVLLECDLKSVCPSNTMLTCLQTKWPNIEINWLGRIPSLN